MLLNIFLVRKCFDLGLECDVDFFNKLWFFLVFLVLLLIFFFNFLDKFNFFSM